MKRPVLTKRDFIRRFNQDEFGNRGPTWQTFQECLTSGYNGKIHIRNRVRSGETYYNVPMNELAFTWSQIRREYDSSQFFFAGMAPHEYNLIQGEVQQSPQGLGLFYATVRDKPMRDALQEKARQVYGIEAIGLLRYYLCPNSYEWLNHLLREYDGHVIEFSTFGINWGTLPNFNTVVWEVRNY